MRRHQRVALDTNVIIYELERNKRYAPLARAVFAWLLQPGHMAVTSTLTMTEILVAPYRAGEPERAGAMRWLLADHPHLLWIAPDLGIADLAAQYRAGHGLKIADALQAATATRAGATCLIGNDPAFRRVPGFETILFDELL